MDDMWLFENSSIWHGTQCPNSCIGFATFDHVVMWLESSLTFSYPCHGSPMSIVLEDLVG